MSLPHEGVCLMSKMTSRASVEPEGRPCGARRTEWVVRTRRDALLQLVPLRTRRGLSAALSLFVRSSHAPPHQLGDRIAPVAILGGACERTAAATALEVGASRTASGSAPP